MRTIQVCIGSACHLKGSYNIITRLQDLIEEHDKTDVEVKAVFCLGECTKAVSAKVDDGTVFSLQAEEVDTFFANEFLS